MQSRLTAIAARPNWVSYSKALQRGVATSYRTADPDAHAKDYEAHEPAVLSGEPEAKPAKEQTDDHRPRGKGTEPFSSPNQPHARSPRLESNGVNQPLDPTAQQKRSHSTALSDLSCAGLDGTPWPDEKGDRQRDRDEQQEEDKDYFKHHKASPLSEIEVADTRKPITRATDGTADSRIGRDVIVWRQEQLDTAEEALRRAAEIWKQNAMRGDPNAPQSRVLRALRGEDF